METCDNCEQQETGGVCSQSEELTGQTYGDGITNTLSSNISTSWICGICDVVKKFEEEKPECDRHFVYDEPICKECLHNKLCSNCGMEIDFFKNGIRHEEDYCYNEETEEGDDDDDNEDDEN